MFGLRRLVRQLEDKLYTARFAREADRAHLEIAIKHQNELKKEVADLKKALEWHVGNSLELILVEEKHIMLRVDETKKQQKSFGERGGQVAQETYDSVGQSVKEKLNGDVSPDTNEGQGSR